MSLFEEWREAAYSSEEDAVKSKQFWDSYFAKEKEVYKVILSDYGTPVTGTVKELSKRFNLDIMTMTGFLDGINESLKKENDLENMTEDSVVSLDYDKEKLYWHMIEAKADWLYSLPQWDVLLTEEKRKELYKDQKQSGTIRKEHKISRNDPCPCGSGKKYKKCCGR